MRIFLGCITPSIIPLDKTLDWGMIVLCCTAAHFAEQFESKKWIAWIGRQVLLARRKALVCVEFCPQPVRNRMVCLLPSMQLASLIAADLNPHPAATIVINAVSRFIRVTCRVRAAYHRMPPLR